MSIEVPDWNRVVTLIGQESDGTPQIVQLDGTGRIVAVIQGEIEGITGPVDVSQTDSVREIQGSDGSALRTVKLDANGQIIMVPRGQSGNYMSVDASGFLTSIIKGTYSGTPTTLAVDASGNIVAVIKGDYGGALKTLATDADGRLQIVPYDPNDIWGNAVAMGNAELAAVMSPAHRYDRRGNIVLVDSFEDGLRKWYPSASGTGASIVLSTVRTRTGVYSAKLTGGSDGPMLAGLLTTLPYSAASRYGVEFSFEISGLADIVELDLTHCDGANLHRAFVRWVRSTSDFEYNSSAGSWQDIDADKPLNIGTGLFHTMKIVYDLSAHNYVRALLNEEEYDLSGVAVQTVVSSASPCMLVALYVTSSAGVNHYAYLDDVVITQNEPA